MFNIRGKLVDSKGSKYAGHHVLASFLEKVEIEEPDAKETRPTEEPSQENQPKLEPLWKPSEQRSNVEANGDFTILLPEKGKIKGTIALRVLAPDGEILAAEDHAIEELEDEITIKVAPKLYSQIVPSKDPFLGKRAKITGRVLDAKGKQPIANKQVVLFARVQGGVNHDFLPVLATKSDLQGYFSGDYPRGLYEEAHGVIAVGNNEPIPVRLSNGAFPRRVIFVVEVPDETGKKECACNGEVPRAPDSEDLTSSSSTYSIDLVSGKCVDFTVPNRSLEEFSFFSVVRTTEPGIKGLTVSDPPKITLQTLSAFSGLLDSATKKSSHIVPGGPMTEPFQNPMFGKIAKAISPDFLKMLTSDPDSFTPNTLMTVEKATAFQQLTNVLEVYMKKTSGRSVITAANPVDWDDTPTFYQATTIAHGHLLHFKQIWRADGYSLGDLLYSLPLAPCQKKQIAVFDWDRRERGARAEQLESEERLDAFLSRDRDISEIVKSTLKESMRGGSESETDSFSAGGGGGFGAEGSLGFVSAAIGGVFGLSGGSGSASSSAWQKSSRTAAAQSAQHLQDTTMQSASAVRSQRATVVQTVRQGETMRVQTETVANHNHCHAITIEYFEVLRHLRVDVELTDVQECLFIPLLMSKFDYAKALRWREPLSRHLRNRALRGAFSAIERIRNNYEGSDLPKGIYAEETLVHMDGELHISFSIPRPPDKDGEPDIAQWEGIFFLTGKSADYWNDKYLREQKEKDRLFEQNVASRVAEELVQKLRFFAVDQNGNETPIDLDATLVSDYKDDTPLYVSIRMTGNMPLIQRQNIKYIKISTEIEKGNFEVTISEVLPTNSKAIVQSGKMRYRTKYMEHNLFNHSRILNDLTGTDDVWIYTPLSQQELRNPRNEDEELAKRLIAHLNEHIEYYHKVIWWRMDKERRYMLLDGFIAPNAGGRSVASVVENRLIGIAGNCLVMPVARGFHLDPTFNQDEEEPIDLLNHYAPTTPIPPIRVSVPTRGVFAEAVMGSCNSCEKKDDTRFWRFEESPCGDEPTAIQPISTDSRRAEPGSLQAKDLPAPIVAFQNAPQAPDPTGMAAAFNLLGKANLFPNITGLDQNQKNALAALLGSFDTTKFMAAQAAELAKEEAKVAQQKAMSEDIQKILQTIKDAKENNLIDEATAQEKAKAALDKWIGGSEATADHFKFGQTDAFKNTLDKATDQGKDVNVEHISSEGDVTKLATHSPGQVKIGQTQYNLHVSPNVPFIKQPTPDTCWAAAATMLKSWKEGKTLNIADIMDQAGQEFRALFDANQGLSSSQMVPFFENLRMGYEQPANYAIDFYAKLLITYGPLWLTLDEDQTPSGMSPHAFILVGIKGDGTPDNTQFILMDPSAEGEAEYPFMEFLQKFEEIANQADTSEPLFLQIAYNLKGQAVGSPRPYDRDATVSYAKTYYNTICSDHYLFSQTDAHYFSDPESASVSNENDCTHFVSCCIGMPPKDNMNKISGGGLFLDPNGFFKGKSPQPYGFTTPNTLLRYLKLTNKIKFLDDQGHLQDDLFYYITTNQKNLNVPFSDPRGDLVFYSPSNQYVKPGQAIDFHHAAIITSIDGATKDKKISCHTANRYDKPLDDVSYAYFVYARVIK